jgi:hypothetical protein
MLRVLSCLLACGFSLGLAAQEKKTTDPTLGLTVPAKVLEDFVAKTPEHTVNNITLKEIPDEENKSRAGLKVSFTAKNRSAAAKPVTVFIVGLDEKNAPLWSLSRNVDLNSMDQENFEDNLVLPPGTAKATTAIWLRVSPR